jgi:hypothetical protein
LSLCALRFFDGLRAQLLSPAASVLDDANDPALAGHNHNAFQLDKTDREKHFIGR